MSDTTSNQFRKALASAIKYHVDTNKLNGVTASKIVGCANSRMSQIIRGEVDKISSDALIDVLAKFGYRLATVVGSVAGHEFALTPLGSHGEQFEEKTVAMLDGSMISVGEAYEIGELSISDDGKIELIQNTESDADRVIADE